MTATPPMVVEGREIHLSNLDRVLYPAAGFTKAALIDYYVRIAPFMLPHLKDRQITLRRFPSGVDEEGFFEKNCPKFHPPWMKTAPAWSDRNGANIDYCLINDLPSLVWIANLAAIELHPLLSLAGEPERPTSVVFDLDPGPPADVLTCAEVALALRSLFTTLDLVSLVKASGSKGLQLYVPLNTKVTYADTKAFALAVAELMERQFPRLVLSSMKKSLREGKVFVDWSQNDPHKTTVCVYSLRARERPTVSTPVAWEELENALSRRDPELLRFEAPRAVDRATRDGDLFAPVLKVKQHLPSGGWRPSRKVSS